MTKKMSVSERLDEEMRETADGFRRLNLINDQEYALIAGQTAPTMTAPTGAEIVAMRRRAKMTQAAFAHCLNVPVGKLDKWERDEKRPRGAAAKLLAIVKQKGVEALQLEPAE